jgi:metal-responsive CopG/Arc/MetJ family transcriptional regulator
MRKTVVITLTPDMFEEIEKRRKPLMVPRSAFIEMLLRKALRKPIKERKEEDMVVENGN